MSVTLGLPNYFASYRLSDGSLVNVRIMDTAGMEIFRAINSTYYKSANCCLLVYDITNIDSFNDCEIYYNEKINQNCPENIPIILLGNKTDLETDRQVPPEKAANFALKYNYIFMETSCLKNENVADAFEALIEMTNREMLINKEKMKNEEETKKIVIDNVEINEKHKKSCCS